MLQIKNAGTADIAVIRELAYSIWPATYKNLLSPDQLQYMLELIYSEASLQNQIENLNHQFILVYNAEIPVGFASYAPKRERVDEKQIPLREEKLTTEVKYLDTEFHGVYHLHKIYVSSSEQGKGTGKYILDHIIKNIKKIGATALELHVKRDNPAITFYQKQGFIITGEIDTDIGRGYFMRDFVMRKEI